MILGALALAWFAGTATAAFTGADPLASLALATLLAAPTFAVRPKPSTLALIAVGTALVFTAAYRYDATAPPDAPSGIARHNDRAPVTFRALVSAEPDAAGGSARYRLSVREVLAGGEWRPESGGVIARLPLHPAYRYGDLLELTAELETPPSFDDFNYRDYLLRRGVGSLAQYPDATLLARDGGSPFRAALIGLRDDLTAALERALPEPESSLAAGVLLGRRAGLPPSLTDDMNATGTSHLVAVSGQNVTLVAAMVLAVLSFAVGRRQAALLALAAVAGYAVLVGGDPSVVRAAVMGGLYVVAVAVGRQSAAPVSLLLAAGVMTALDPQVVHDVSFQLSFAATLGLMTLAPALTRHLAALTQRFPTVDAFPLTRPTLELAGVTLAAIAFTLPITAVNFGRVSLVAPFANLLAVPAFLAVAATAAVTAVVGALVPEAAPALGWLSFPPAAYTVAVVQAAASVPLASIAVDGVTVWHAMAAYAALAGLVWLITRSRPDVSPPPVVAPSARRPLVPAAGIAVVLALASALVWLSLTAPVGGRLTVTFLDVGQGDAILIEGPEGHRVLVDGGPSEDAIASALGRALPFYDRRIDLIVLTHPDSDHLGGLPAVLERYDVRVALAGPADFDTPADDAWRDALTAAVVPLHTAAPGQTVDLGRGALLEVLAAPADAANTNDSSLVLRITMGEASFLLTGDIEADAEAALLRSGAGVGAVVYKVPHHGSRSSTTSEFLAAVDPAIDVISVGADNRFGHPAAEVLDRFEGDSVYRTDLHGDISLSTDGARLWVRTQR